MALGQHVHSDLWHEADAGARFRKTKAHRTLQEAQQQGDLDDNFGNDEVDQKCRARATELLPPAWDVHASDHYQLLVRSLQTLLKSNFPKPSCKPKQEWISQAHAVAQRMATNT